MMNDMAIWSVSAYDCGLHRCTWQRELQKHTASSLCNGRKHISSMSFSVVVVHAKTSDCAVVSPSHMSTLWSSTCEI